MIALKCPFLWNGRLIAAGTRLSLPAETEEKLLRAGNAAQKEEGLSPLPLTRPDESAQGDEKDKSMEKQKRAAEPPAELALGR